MGTLMLTNFDNLDSLYTYGTLQNAMLYVKGHGLHVDYLGNSLTHESNSTCAMRTIMDKGREIIVLLTCVLTYDCHC